VKPLVLLALLCGGCLAGPRVLGPGTIYTDVAAPEAYRADLPRGGHDVRGEACQTGLFFYYFSLAWGDGGYADAMRDAQAQAPGATLSDVRADLQVLSVLTVFRQQCVVVTAAASP
jgi:TRL-like protein family